jgi:hypothetical protein
MKHKNSPWSAQKGTHVKWAKDRRSGEGVVKRRIDLFNKQLGYAPFDEAEFIVIDDETQEEIHLRMRQISPTKMPRWKRRLLYKQQSK